MTEDELRTWFHTFHPRVRGFQVEEPGGHLRDITNVEMNHYVEAAHILQADLRKAAEIVQFLFGENNHE
jgi:hypothetical protein